MKKKTLCPQCGAVAKRKKTNILIAVTEVIVALIANKGPVLALKPKNRYFCSNCGHEWTE